MKLFVVGLCLASMLLSVTASAVEEVATDPVTIETTKEEEGVTVNVTIQSPEAPVSASETVVDGEESLSETALLSPYSVTSLDSSPVPETLTIEEPATMSAIVTSVLGEYERRTYTVSHYDDQGALVATSTEYVPGLAGLDYAWIAGAVLFALFSYCVLRLIGGMLSR